MRKSIASLSVALVATVALTTLGVAPARATSGAQLWAKRYNDPGNKFDAAYSLAVSPSGDRVFVTGESTGATSREDYITIAYNAATGAQLWVQRYNGPGNNTDSAHSVAVSPGGDRVFVTGESTGATSRQDYATIAYNAATGAQLWVERYDGPGKDLDSGQALVVTSQTVFVTGQSTGATSREDYATIAYDAATGFRWWVKRYNGPGNSIDGANSIKASPNGGLVFVSGFSPGVASGNDYATIAYNAITGASLWVKRYNGPASGDDTASSLAVSPAGDRVFVTGQSTGATTLSDYVTVAYDAATGARLWATRYNGRANSNDLAYSVAVGPGGKRVFVTGFSVGAGSQEDYATVAYDAATGAQLWAARYNGPGNWTDRAYSVAVSPNGSTVFVTGYSAGTTLRYDYATVAYRN